MGIGYFLFLIAVSPFTIPFAPFVTLITYFSLETECNQVVGAHVQNVSRIDGFQCSMILYVPEVKRMVTLPPMQCSDIIRCRTQKCTNISIALNRWHGEKSCVKVIKSNANIREVLSYNITLAWFIKSVVESILLIAILMYSYYTTHY